MSADPQRILVVKLSALGDLFHAVPVVHRLREAYGCPVDWVTQPEYMELARCHRDVERVIGYPRRGGVGAWRAFVRELRAERYGLALDLQGLFKSGVVLGLARAGRKVSPVGAREGSRMFAGEQAVAGAPTSHAMDRLFDSLRTLGVDPEPVDYPLSFPAAEPLPGGRPRLAVAPKSRWPAKDWPLENYAEAIRRLRGEHGADVVILGGPGDREAGEVLEGACTEGVWNLCGQTPLLALGSQLREVDGLLCNDSGPMHFAAAVGTPVVALFGPTDPGRTGPWGRGHRVLRPPPGPEGYPEHRAYKRGSNAFIARISVEEVVEAVGKCLSENSGGEDKRLGK